MKLIFFISMLLLVTFGCRKQQPEMNAAQNACDCIEETSAEFTINEVVAIGLVGYEFSTETDTCYANRNMRFIPKMKNAEYTWYIGSEIVNAEILGRYFSLAQGGQDIPVTLVVKKQANNVCFPNDDGYDSITKSFHVASYDASFNTMANINTYLEGPYRLFDANNPDSIDIKIDIFYEHHQANGNGVRVINLHGVNDTIQTDEIGKTFRQLRIYDKLIGDLVIKLDGTVNFNFKDNTISPPKIYALKGRKL
jgi:hypothetical protein